MADNVTLAGKTFATDQVTRGGATVDVEIVKLGFGDNNSYTGDVSRSVPLPVDAALRTDVIQSSGSQLTPKFASISITTTTSIVAAVTGKRIVVVALFMTVDIETGDESYQFKDDAGGTVVTGSLGDGPAGTVIPISMGFNPVGWFRSASGKPLELALGGTTPSAQGCLTYIEV